MTTSPSIAPLIWGFFVSSFDLYQIFLRIKQAFNDSTSLYDPVSCGLGFTLIFVIVFFIVFFIVDHNLASVEKIILG